MKVALQPVLLAVVALTAPDANAQEPSSKSLVELGAVAWGRDLDAALRRSEEEGKPVFALFQEIPGCLTCRNFGEGPLSHPLLVEAIEELFVPLAVYNNRGGEDARVLKRYGEPAWNNPVVRFLDAQGEDVLERRDGLWSAGDVATRAIAALLAAGREVPTWLSLVAEEASAGPLEEATFATACFWDGEVRLGALDGVVGTRAGWQGGREVVEVRFDSAQLQRTELVERALRLGFQLAAGSALGAAKPSDRKFHLRRSPLRHLPLTPMQRTKLNAALGRGADITAWLSPRQRALLERVETALADQPHLLDDLEEAAGVAELPGYEARLLQRLGS